MLYSLNSAFWFTWIAYRETSLEKALAQNAAEDVYKRQALCKNPIRKEGKMMKKGLALLLTLCLLLIPGCSSKKENVIKIVDGRVTEQKLVHRMIKMLVEDRTDLTVSIGEEMTAVNAYNEMKQRVYDVYMSYDGTVLTTFLHRDPSEVPAGSTLFDYTNELFQEQDKLVIVNKLGPVSYTHLFSGNH